MSVRSRMIQRLGRSVNHANGDAVVVQEVAQVPVVRESRLVNVGQGAFNPPFNAQFQLQVIPLFFTEAADVYTPVTQANAVANWPGAIQVALPVFLFGNIDFESGYPVLKGQFPIGGGWAYNAPVVYGKTVGPAAAFGPWDVNVTNLLRDGDLIFPYTVISGGTNYMALKVVRTADVPFASLLNATNSNMFTLNMVRYVVATNGAADLAQYGNPILCGDETMFGRFSKDTVNPEGFKNPEQQQDNIIDIDFEFRVSKQKSLSTYCNFNAGAFRLQMFVASAEKIV